MFSSITTLRSICLTTLASMDRRGSMALSKKPLHSSKSDNSYLIIWRTLEGMPITSYLVRMLKCELIRTSQISSRNMKLAWIRAIRSTSKSWTRVASTAPPYSFLASQNKVSSLVLISFPISKPIPFCILETGSKVSWWVSSLSCRLLKSEMLAQSARKMLSIDCK